MHLVLFSIAFVVLVDKVRPQSLGLERELENTKYGRRTEPVMKLRVESAAAAAAPVVVEPPPLFSLFH